MPKKAKAVVISNVVIFPNNQVMVIDSFGNRVVGLEGSLSEVQKKIAEAIGAQGHLPSVNYLSENWLGTT